MHPRKSPGGSDVPSRGPRRDRVSQSGHERDAMNGGAAPPFFPDGEEISMVRRRSSRKESMSVVIDEASKRLSGGPGLRAIADFAAASHGRAAAWLVVLCLIAFLPGFFTIPPLDRDEARFAQATKQMLESACYADIRSQDESRYKKPVGIYWLQAGVVKLGEAAGVPRAHTRIWLYQLPLPPRGPPARACRPSV